MLRAHQWPCWVGGPVQGGSQIGLKVRQSLFEFHSATQCLGKFLNSSVPQFPHPEMGRVVLNLVLTLRQYAFYLSSPIALTYFLWSG
jgi:hypothetical protein